MEELLNKLIEKGWKPFGRKYNSETGGDHNTISFNYYDNIDEERGLSNFSIRELVSKESGLWQFCEENGMITNWNRRIKNDFPLQADEGEDACVYNGCYECKIIESALCDEDKLEEFLLENIKVE